ncbi:hypothetical protein VOI32_39275 [Paraburkholderia caribensis]|uniref:MarR family transcriptional regulator n=1 Tax=Paraburkholderia caribensis TaxID=75105 RepID=A0ABV0E902_9BURK|nr:hypothetical protein [Paraburkholderia caribensis]MCO4882719.1 hypothetical protein [Paraburkholderia caribensis]PTB23832.1 hypothetical protein C9I56_37220 [Paraburkholderia caribensis]
MSTHANAKALLAWLRDRESATVEEIAASGLMKSRTASDAIQYAVRSGALERVVRAGASAKERMRYRATAKERMQYRATAKERMQYRATGVALPAPRMHVALPSFDGLLEAWGIAREPVALPATEARRHQIADHE